MKEIKHLDYTLDKIMLITEIKEMEVLNENIKEQNGAFIFLNSNFSMLAHLNAKYLNNPYKTIQKVIKHHQIPYTSLLEKEGEFYLSEENNIFKYLSENGKNGFSLFRDDQALLFDFKNPRFLEFCKKKKKGAS